MKRKEFPACESRVRTQHLNAASFSGLFSVISPDSTDIVEPGEAEAYPRHECGFFGVFGHRNAAVLTYCALFALQHRGPESAWSVTSNGPETSFVVHKEL